MQCPPYGLSTFNSRLRGISPVALKLAKSARSMTSCGSSNLRCRAGKPLCGDAGAISERQPAMYSPLGGGSLKVIGKPGEIVWSRVFVEGGALHCDIGRGTVVSLPAAETERRWPRRRSSGRSCIRCCME